MMIHPDHPRPRSTQLVEGWLVFEDPVELDVLDKAALHARLDVALEVLLGQPQVLGGLLVQWVARVRFQEEKLWQSISTQPPTFPPSFPGTIPAVQR
jgi:hypothetical protein